MSEYYDVRYELTVVHAVKGVADGDRVVMFGDVSGGSSCGNSDLTPGERLYAILSSASGGRFVADSTPACGSALSIDALESIDITLPPTSPGPVSLVVVGRLGEAELISYDSRGRPVAYANLPWRTGQPAVCPGSETVVQLEQVDRDTAVLVTRDLATLREIDRVAVTDSATDQKTRDALAAFIVDGSSLQCRSEDGTEVVALLSWWDTDGEETRIVRLTDGTIAVTEHGEMDPVLFDPRSDDVIGLRNGDTIRVDTSTGSETIDTGGLPDGLPEPSDAESSLVLDDGRQVRMVTADGASTVEVVGLQGQVTTLQRLLTVRRAVAVTDGPTVDPAEVERELAGPLVESEWITRDASPSVGGNSGDTSATASHSDDPNLIWPVGIAITVAVAIAVGVTAVRRRRV